MTSVPWEDEVKEPELRAAGSEATSAVDGESVSAGARKSLREDTQIDPTQVDPSVRPIPLIVAGLRKVYHDASRGQVWAVGGIDFECRFGEIFGLLGANGAGKTTTLRMLSTVLKPSGGRVLVMGQGLRKNPRAVRRSIGFYSATTALYPRLTVRETLKFFAQVNGYGKERVPRRIEYLVERFGLREFIDARVDVLSTGMKQKVSLARTLAHDPPVLIFDEPTVGLDVLAAQELLSFIEELRADGKTIVYSTHIMSEAQRLCDRIGILHRGTILACDTLQGLRNQSGQHYLEDIFLHFVRGQDSGES